MKGANMKNIHKKITISLITVGVASISFYIPFKVHHIDPRDGIYDGGKLIASMFNSALEGSVAVKDSLVGAVATGVKNASKNVKNKNLNVFTIDPWALLQITAPAFDLLPLNLKTTSKTTQTNPLKQSLDNSSAPLLPKKISDPSDAIVNIFCSQKIGKLRRTITGSGILINNDGTVLTNAHVGEFPLLSETNPNILCLARHGNPANGALSVKVAFISPEWVKEYGKYINTEGTPQTGKSDFAILKIQKPTSGLSTTQDKNSLGAIIVQKTLPNIGDRVNAIAYPADILSVKGVDSSLYLQKEQLTLANTYSLDVTTSDILETSPSSVVGQRGSSGGALTDQDGHLIGMITMVVDSKTKNKTNNSKLATTIRALSMNHVDAEISNYTGISLADIVNRGSHDINANFSTSYRDYLSKILSGYLNK